jgi:uncharacterized protein
LVPFASLFAMTSANLPSLIQRMLQPDFYPHSVHGEVELLQTHVSYVFLTGDFVYKLKKAVNFGFLDYSTVAKRQHFCAEEIRLNQRGAKDLYLEVLPITVQGNDFVLNGVGEPVEYALKMVQFPQDQLLSNMFESGLVTVAQMAELGKVVADFHAKSQTSAYISSFGAVSQVRQSIEDNYRQTIKYLGIAQTQQHYDETKAFTDGFFDRFSAAFERRVSGGFIRECHGDLHLRNVCIWQDRIQLFDCIEFNEPFRYVDTMYDVAFAVMDLTARGRTDLANVFLNSYLEQTGDWEGLEVLPLYLSRQAYVRAKVTSFLLDDLGIPEADRSIAHKTASDYYQLAWQYTQIPQGRLILMAGLSGAGKSTLAKEIAKKTNAIHLRSDAIRKHLGGVKLQEKGGNDLYTSEMTAKTYDRLRTLGIQLAQKGYTVILDGKFDKQSLRQSVLAVVGDLPTQIIHCYAPIDMLKQRLEQRVGDIADATADLLASQQAGWEVFTATEAPLVTTVDTTQNLSAFLETI